MSQSVRQPDARCVLVVDDDDDARPALCSYLNALGYRVFPAASGAEAVELLGRHAGEVGVAVVDLHMPGLGGLGTAAQLKRRKPQLRCFVVGGDGDLLGPTPAPDTLA